MIWDNSSTSLQYCHITSSDGSKALYNFQDIGGLPELHFINLDTGAKSLIVQLVDGNDLLQFPALSPDGTIARWKSGGYNATRRVIATGDMRDTFSSRFPEASSIGAGNVTDITEDNRYYYMGSEPAAVSYIHRIDMAPAGTAPAPDISSITFGQPQLTYGDTTPVTVTVQVSDPKGLDNIQSVQMQPLVDGRERPTGEIYEPLVYQNPLTNSGGGVFTGTVYPQIWFSYNTHYPLPRSMGVRIVARNKDEHYVMADTSITVLPLIVLNPLTSPTNLSSLTIGGTVAPGSTVTVATDTPASDGLATVSGGTWSYTITGLVWGDNVVTVTARSTTGSTSVSTATITRKPLLTVSVAGDGGGTVASTPGTISCQFGTCSELFTFNTPVSLTAVPNVNSLFGGWAGDGTSPDANHRDTTMDGDKNVTATFSYVKPAWIEGTTQYYESLQTAYNEALNGQTICAREYTFAEPLILDQDKRVTIKGGYALNYVGRSGCTLLQGKLTVRRGRVVTNLLKVK